MRQVVQQQSNGEISVVDVPPPVLRPDGVLVQVRASVISSGTERAMRRLAQESLLGKARARPDLVRKVVERTRQDGISQTVATVRDRLDAPDPVGYSASGVVIAVGERAAGFRPGQLVACAGGGYANHAEIVYVPATLCAAVPPSVPPTDAAFATVGAVALHGIHQAGLSQGESVVVAGLGLIGQLSVRLLRAYGHPVVGVDPSDRARGEVERLGVPTFDLGTDPPEPADAVLLTAATSSSDLMATAPSWCRDRGRVVVVGDVGLDVPRRPYYDGEVEIRFSRSYGPGRYDPDHEEGGHDYPVGYVRWTEGRNLGEVVRLLAAGLLEVEDLVTDRYPLDQASAAYRRLEDGAPVRALVLTYGDGGATTTTTTTTAGTTPVSAGPVVADALGLALCGAGLFARMTLIPAFEATGRTRWTAVASATGISAAHVAHQHGFERAVGTAEEAATDPNAHAVVVATRHDTHAALCVTAVDAGKAVFVEKPLAVNEQELAELEAHQGDGRVMTGYNRRFAPATRAVVNALGTRRGPLTLALRVNAGRLPAGHWADHADQGGRLIGEACHFVDLACFLVGAPVERVAVAGAGLRPPRTEDTASILMHFGDGSSASLSYLATGSPKLPKERIEAHWDGNSAVVDDFRHWVIRKGRRTVRHRGRRQDKGHRAEVAAFVGFALDGGANPVPLQQSAHVSRVTFAMVAAIADGQWKNLPATRW